MDAQIHNVPVPSARGVDHCIEQQKEEDKGEEKKGNHPFRAEGGSLVHLVCKICSIQCDSMGRGQD
jgi:hypothetical protein